MLGGEKVATGVWRGVLDKSVVNPVAGNAEHALQLDLVPALPTSRYSR